MEDDCRTRLKGQEVVVTGSAIRRPRERKEEQNEEGRKDERRVEKERVAEREEE